VSTTTKKKRTKTQAKKYANMVFSNYIRERDKWTCYTCGKVGSVSDMQCGHLISRYFAATLYDELNAVCQCQGCNMRHEIDPEIYKQRYILDYGEDAYWELYKKSKQPCPRKVADYEQIASFYVEKLHKLQHRRYEYTAKGRRK
jgi:hypothetical protein